MIKTKDTTNEEPRCRVLCVCHQTAQHESVGNPQKGALNSNCGIIVASPTDGVLWSINSMGFVGPHNSAKELEKESKKSKGHSQSISRHEEHCFYVK